MNEHFRNRQWLIASVLLVLATLALLKIQHGLRNAERSSIDLRLQYTSAGVLAAGKNPWKSYLETAGTSEAVSYLMPTYPPSALMLFIPLLTPWDFGRLATVWAVLNWLLWTGALVAIWHQYFTNTHWKGCLAVALVGLSIRAVHHSIGNGQFGTFALAFLVYAV